MVCQGVPGSDQDLHLPKVGPGLLPAASRQVPCLVRSRHTVVGEQLRKQKLWKTEETQQELRKTKENKGRT